MSRRHSAAAHPNPPSLCLRLLPDPSPGGSDVAPHQSGGPGVGAEGQSCLHLSAVRGRASTSLCPPSLHRPAPGNSARAWPKTIRFLVGAGRWRNEAEYKKLGRKQLKGTRINNSTPPTFLLYLDTSISNQEVFFSPCLEKTCYLKPEKFENINKSPLPS